MSELFLHIFNTGITAGWLVLAVVVTRLLLKKAPAWIKCALWAIVALRLVWPFEIESILSLIPSTQTLPPAELHQYAPQLHTGISAANSAINPVFTEVFASEPANSVNPLQVTVAIASYVWVVGMVAMAVYASVSYWRLRRRVQVSMPAGDGVYLCDHISSPFILGIFRPRIYLPSELSQEKWESILAHEQAHLARKDHWWKPLGFVLLTVFWFHPLLWLAYILLCRDVELACDEKVIKALSAEEKQAYSKVLLECSVPKRWITACPLAFGETGVKQRIKAVLSYKKPTLWIIIAALIIGSVLALCFLTEPEKNPFDDQGGSFQTVYQISGHVYSPSNVSYVPELSGSFRIIEDNVLQYQSVVDTDKNLSYEHITQWTNVGTMEAFALTEENFDNRFYSGGPIEMKDKAREIRENNKNAWRVDGETGCFGTVCYFLEQKNGAHYFVFGQVHLFELTKTLVQDLSIQVAGKSYIYEKTEDPLWQFAIHIQEDGTFSYYDGVLSSYFGHGEWEQKDEKLYLYDEGLSQTRTFVFTVESNALVFCANESDRFTYTDVADGERFFAEGQLTHQRNLVWVQIESIIDGHMLALDRNRNRWHIILPEDIEWQGNIYNECWVSYYSTAEKLTDTTYGGYSIQYEVTATACWDHIRNENLRDKYDLVTGAYDYCQYDIDGDGVEETCIISHGFSSGIFTIMISVWDEETCEYSKPMMTGWAKGYAFMQMENGLKILSSTGDCFYLCYMDGEIRILR